jgi:putative iron-regulated protein
MKSLVPCASLLLLIASGCTKDTVAPVDFDAATMLADLSSKVILPTYQQLEGSTASLVYNLDLFYDTPTQANLDHARTQWLTARQPWDQLQAFQFGPVVTQGFTATIDGWPVDRAGIEAVLAGNATLSHEYIYGLDSKLKGFHAIEYLLFGPNGTKTLGEFTQREREYLVWAGSNLGQAANALDSYWWRDAGDYLAHAGATGNNLYPTRAAGMRALVNGMIAICDTLANVKIGRPLDQQDPALEESPFSNSSVLDFVGNMQGVLNLYAGNRGILELIPGKYGIIPGSGIRDLVLANIPDMDQTIQLQIKNAIVAVQQVPPPFGEALRTNSARVEAARARIRDLEQTLEIHVLPLTQ